MMEWSTSPLGGKFTSEKLSRDLRAGYTTTVSSIRNCDLLRTGDYFKTFPSPIPGHLPVRIAGIFPKLKFREFSRPPLSLDESFLPDSITFTKGEPNEPE